ncbi:hypothetical protein [Flavobacterium piscis]|uniref:RNA polymerase-binding transcription factor DksA n=1 Tax=Flavobacterium piscis TaxID=1114874 RepID=A0ABU1Y7E5_9FLAO|nr:hypothetical protein [Flavobacterium piscis]MDR7210144.1 RNA polymerase-binding transcription factor DksA [Flavobacterium piscis]
MLGLFNNKKGEAGTSPEWLQTLDESKERLFLFLDKLEAKMEELCSAAIPELNDLMANDEDIYKRTFHRVYAGVNGQLSNIRQKASDVYDEKIIDLYENINAKVSVLNPHHSLLSNFRTECSERHHRKFEEKYQYWQNQLEKTQERDLEIEYQKVLTEYNSIKNSFNCKQCGGNITIEKIFFIDTYIPCMHCQTQNTFEPSTQARMLQIFARNLAEQRTAHLYEIYQTEYNKERDLYHKKHELSLSRIHENDKNALAQKQVQMEELENQRQESIKNAPKLYRIYLRAMYDEWNKITPDLKEHHEKLYENQINY